MSLRNIFIFHFKSSFVSNNYNSLIKNDDDDGDNGDDDGGGSGNCDRSCYQRHTS